MYLELLFAMARCMFKGNHREIAGVDLMAAIKKMNVLDHIVQRQGWGCMKIQKSKGYDGVLSAFDLEGHLQPTVTAKLGSCSRGFA